MAKLADNETVRFWAGNNVPGKKGFQPGSSSIVDTTADPRTTLVLPPASISDTGWGWESQSAQYPATATPGHHYEVEQFPGPDGKRLYPIECLTHYGADSKLDAILNRYPDGYPQLERSGAINLWVRPDAQRQGIGTGMLAEIETHGRIDWAVQTFSPRGRALSQSYLNRSNRVSRLSSPGLVRRGTVGSGRYAGRSGEVLGGADSRGNLNTGSSGGTHRILSIRSHRGRKIVLEPAANVKES
jgi:GNAT superfamily N-acetyltransferase